MNNFELEEITRDKASDLKPKKPNMWQVFILNDDYTHAHFVIDVLKIFFGMTENLAMNVMLEAHKSGKAICGTFTHEIAETKAHQVKTYASQHQHPLNCDIEELE